ncbi:MAG: hypothetical protein ACD_46C00722G0003 [uncultured bacterium]|nr:MAG: hypothetical protein ACD_46C00722G0003 [uncultured bacterium]
MNGRKNIFESEFFNTYCESQRHDLFEEPSLSPFVYFDLKVIGDIAHELKISTNIKKFRLLVANNIDNKKDVSSAALYLKWIDENGKLQHKVVTVKIDQIENLKNLFLMLNAKEVRIFSRLNSENLNWYELSEHDIYSKYDPYSFYDVLHQQIIEAVKTITNQKNQSAVIIDGGCGSGTLLKKMEKEEQLASKTITLIGFDFNQKNINDCVNGYTGKCQFTRGDLLKIDKIITDYNLQNHDETTPIILTLSGSLTRLVLPDAFAGLSVLQDAALQRIDFLVGGGIGEPLITDYIAKRVGYKPMVIPSIDNKQKFFAYQKMTDEEILSNKKAKMNKQNILDLSLCPNPEVLLEKLKKDIITKNYQLTIDLSYCKYSPGLAKKLEEILIQAPGTKLIFWHHDMKTYNDFSRRFLGCARIISLNHPIGTMLIEPNLMAPKGFLFSFRKEEQGFHQQDGQGNFSNRYFDYLKSFYACSREARAKSNLLLFLTNYLTSAAGIKMPDDKIAENILADFNKQPNQKDKLILNEGVLSMDVDSLRERPSSIKKYFDKLIESAQKEVNTDNLSKLIFLARNGIHSNEKRESSYSRTDKISLKKLIAICSGLNKRDDKKFPLTDEAIKKALTASPFLNLSTEELKDKQGLFKF